PDVGGNGGVSCLYSAARLDADRREDQRCLAGAGRRLLRAGLDARHARRPGGVRQPLLQPVRRECLMTNAHIPAYARGYENFPGHIGRTAEASQRAWPREQRAPHGAPNIVVMLLDDMGYSDIGPFGSEIA